MPADLPHPNIVDLIALAVVAIGLVQGLWRGLSGEIARLISLVAVLILGLYYIDPVAAAFESHTRLGETASRAVGYIVIVLAAFVGMLVLRYLLKRVMQVTFVPGIERWGGAVAGLLRAAVLVLIVYICMNLVPNPFLNRHFGEESMIGTVVLRHLPAFEEHMQELSEELERTRAEAQDDPPPEHRELN